MTSSMEKVIGVLGGMGPAATSVFFQRLVQLTPARRDQEHLKIVVINNPKIPDRTAHISGIGKSPIPALAEGAQDLVRLGAEIIAIPCNTAHYFWRAVQDSVSVPVLNIVTETAARTASEIETGSSVGILATPATIGTGLYQRALAARGLQGIAPEKSQQEQVTRAISLIKEEGDRLSAARCIEECLQYLEKLGVQAAIFGCTELGLAPTRTDLPIFNSLEILAQVTIARALGKKGEEAEQSLVQNTS